MTMEQDDLGIGRPVPLTEQVAATIRSAIVSGRLAAGERLSVPDLARRLRVSRTPTREGLLALEREGLVRQRAGSGMEVLHGDAGDLREVMEVREGLEATAARLAAERMTDADRSMLADNLARQRAALADGDAEAHLVLDQAFHLLLRQGAGNARLARLLDQVAQQLQVLNRAISAERGWSAEAIVKDHSAVADAIVAHDPAAAEAAMRRHIRRVCRFWQELEQASERTSPR